MKNNPKSVLEKANILANANKSAWTNADISVLANANRTILANANTKSILANANTKSILANANTTILPNANTTILAMDTSNYTTSAAVLTGGFEQSHGLVQSRLLLPVKEGEKGLRQSDAVFLHIKQLPEVIEKLGICTDIHTIGYSNAPRDCDDSYMPCFKVGEAMARSMASVLGVPCHAFSHQAGHIAAAAFGLDQLPLLKEEFYAFHLSGGTLECVLVRPDQNKIITCTLVGGTADISAGQAIDRVGVMLGLKFPCGPELEQLALKSSRTFNRKAPIKDGRVCLSGIENLCKERYNTDSPEDIARFCLDYVGLSIADLSNELTKARPNAKIVYCGGVAANSIIRNKLDCDRTLFAPVPFCTDNAVGTAVLTAIKEGVL